MLISMFIETPTGLPNFIPFGISYDFRQSSLYKKIWNRSTFIDSDLWFDENTYIRIHHFGGRKRTLTVENVPYDPYTADIPF
jgi:hypothetical protein